MAEQQFMVRTAFEVCAQHLLSASDDAQLDGRGELSADVEMLADG
jgi:hypothetical protein